MNDLDHVSSIGADWTPKIWAPILVFSYNISPISILFSET